MVHPDMIEAFSRRETMADTVRETLGQIVNEDVGEHDGSAQEILIASKRLATEALAGLEVLEREHAVIREIQTAAREGLYDPMPDAITVEGALSQILVLTDAILGKERDPRDTCHEEKTSKYDPDF